MFYLLAKLVERCGEALGVGFWQIKVGSLQIIYEVIWFIDHSRFHFSLCFREKEVYHKLIEGAIPQCELL